MNVYEKLINVQNELKAPKNQYNSFGKYNYRSCEDIMEALKPVCLKNKALTFISDEVVEVGTRQYVKATVTFIDIESGEKVEVNSLAREEESKKGMDGSQVTGASSSYARKYALNGMFCIDDTKDSDSTNKHDKEDKKATQSGLSVAQINRLYTIGSKAKITPADVLKVCRADYKVNRVEDLTKADYDTICKRLEDKAK